MNYICVLSTECGLECKHALPHTRDECERYGFAWGCTACDDCQLDEQLTLITGPLDPCIACHCKPEYELIANAELAARITA